MWFWKFCHFESPLDFDRILKNDFILYFWVELREFFQNICSFKILEAKNEDLSVKSEFLSSFSHFENQIVTCLNSLNFAFWWGFNSILSGLEYRDTLNKPLQINMLPKCKKENQNSTFLAKFLTFFWFFDTHKEISCP